MGTNSNGFSLLELIVIIGILGITIAFAVPNLTTMIANNRITAGASDFVAALQFAKGEAVSRVNPVTICNRNAAGTGCVAASDWSQGWIVFSDANDNGALDNGEEVLLNHEPLNQGITFRGTAAVANSITYRPSGSIVSRPPGANNSVVIASTQALVICDGRGFGNFARGILVTITGRGSVMNASDTGQRTCL